MREQASASGTTFSQAPSPAKQQCYRGCRPGVLRRINRISLLERTLLTWLGFYPWECVSCRRKHFLRSQGRKPSTASSTSV